MMMYATLAVVLAALTCATPVFGACVTNPVNQPQSTFPPLIGKLLYHSYVSLGDGTSQIFVYDFAAGTLTQLSQPSWGVTDPINASFSPDGNWITFSAVNNGAHNVFLFRLGATAPVDLTMSTGATRNEDPKFSIDGTKLVFKQNNDVKLAPLIFSNGVPSLGAVTNLTGTGASTENSMPFLSPDFNTVYFTVGTSQTTLSLKSKPATAGGATTTFDSTSGLTSYFPIVRSDGTVLFVKWQNAANMRDQIWTRTATGGSPIQLSINDCNSNNSDPWPVNGTSYTFFSSTTAGGYQLYLGNAANGNRWTLTPYGVNADTSKAKLGSSYR